MHKHEVNLTKVRVQRAEGTSQLQDWNLECKDLE